MAQAVLDDPQILELCDEFFPGDPPEYFFDRNPTNFPTILNIYRLVEEGEGVGGLIQDGILPHEGGRLCHGVAERPRLLGHW